MKSGKICKKVLYLYDKRLNRTISPKEEVELQKMIGINGFDDEKIQEAIEQTNGIINKRTVLELQKSYTKNLLVIFILIVALVLVSSFGKK